MAASGGAREHVSAVPRSGDPQSGSLLDSSYSRPAIAGLLLLVALAGLAAYTRVGAGHGPWHQHGMTVALGLELVLAGLEVAVLVLRRRRPHSPYPAAQLRTVLSRVIGVLMLVVAVIMLVNVAAHRGASKIMKDLERTPKAPQTSKAHTSRPLFTTHASGTGLTDLLYGVLALLFVAAVVACVLYLRRSLPAAPAGYEDEPEDDETLRQAVESGRAALTALDDARRAIIACYVAMEASLATAGAARNAAETPDELLARAAGAGLIRGPAAARLTALFYEARFSSHALPPAARDDALQALDALSASLARPVSAEVSQ